MKSKNETETKKANYKIECNSVITLKGMKDVGVTKNAKDFEKRMKMLKTYAKQVGLSIWTDEPIDVPLGDEAFDGDDDDYTRS